MTDGNLAILDQLERLLARLDPEAYARPLPLFDGASIGQHLRHILDAYECLLRGLPQGTVDYSSRRRRADIERSPRLARELLRDYRRQIATLDPQAPVRVRADHYRDGSPEREDPVFPSSAGRELQYARDHAVHHLAIIRMGVAQAFPQIELEPDLGVAPSTIAYRQTGP